MTNRRWIAPEVVQTSTMDCGPAALKSLLEGHGISASYGRLREACQTQIDGTSIDALEDIAGQLGLEASQILVPVDHVLLEGGGGVFPAILVVLGSNGANHFVVLWNRIGPFVQLMDPGVGRRWTTVSRLRSEIYVHTALLDAADVDGWLRSDDFLDAFRRRIRALDVERELAPALQESLGTEGYEAVAALDACVRMVASLVEVGSLGRGAEAASTILSLWPRARAQKVDEIVPDRFWAVRRTETEQVTMRGAVLVHVSGPRTSPRDEDSPPLPPELVRALNETPPRPVLALWRELRKDGLFAPVALLAGILISVLCGGVEAVLLRGLLDVGRRLGLQQQRLGAMGIVLAFGLGLLLLDLVVEGGVLRLGRRLEARVRVAFQSKIPRLGDRYFQSRPISDMADRAHQAHVLRTLPELTGSIVRATLELAVTTMGLVWIDSKSAALAIVAGVLAALIPLAGQKLLTERDLKMRTHAGALSRYHLEALLASAPLRAHGAERALRRDHERLVSEWGRAGRQLLTASTSVHATLALCSVATTIPLVIGYVSRVVDPTNLLLFLYWALSLPVIGEELVGLVRQYPAVRNRTLRLLEPLGALEDDAGDGATAARDGGGVDLVFEEVSVLAGGRPILEGVNLRVAPGEHVAIVGGSGAGKSSLVGLLLGWHAPARGRVLVDGAPLGGDSLAELRRRTAWVDPSVHIWNASMYENLRYGREGDVVAGSLLDRAELRTLVEQLPEGLQTALGEAGGLLSGGEGQRVRLGRALANEHARLVLFDEPFRGVDGTVRSRLTEAARKAFADATLLFVSHDIADTLGFPRVLVVEDGRIVEDGAPHDLERDETSRFHALLAADRRVHGAVWGSDIWRRVRVEDGSAQVEVEGTK